MSIIINVADHILYEDQYIIVVDKPGGLMVEPDRNGHPNLVHQVQRYVKNTLSEGEEHYAQHIHRIDRPVSGIVLFARQRSVLKNLSEQFAERKVKKYYQALTSTSPISKQGFIEHWHRKEKKKAVLQKEEFPYAEKASLSYEVNEQSTTRYRWSIELHTGKFHQIRAQLASLNCPIIGDSLYGSEVAYNPGTIALNAYKLTFSHPVSNKVMTIQSHYLLK